MSKLSKEILDFGSVISNHYKKYGDKFLDFDNCMLLLNKFDDFREEALRMERIIDAIPEEKPKDTAKIIQLSNYIKRKGNIR